MAFTAKPTLACEPVVPFMQVMVPTLALSGSLVVLAVAVVLDPAALKASIQAIRRLVCEHFYLREMRDPELMVRSNRRGYVLPRQLAMYIVRQLTGATLQEIGREFGGRHHVAVLHSINKIEEMRRADKPLNRTITGLMDAFAART